MAEQKYLAFDIGAESGRALVGAFDGDRLTLDEAHRFANGGQQQGDWLVWDAPALFAALKAGLTKAAHTYGSAIASLGIDTWGVDFGLVGRDGALLAPARHYRDAGNEGMPEAAFEIVPRAELFATTGIQFLQFNSLFQLLYLKQRRPELLAQTHRLLMMPDLLAYWFTGESGAERTIASTTQMVDAATGDWARGLLERLGLPTAILPEICPSGAVRGSLTRAVTEETGADALRYVAPAEHDTGSAVVAVPMDCEDSVWISSGTWSLMGVELEAPRISPETLRSNFTNEAGVFGTTRLLKNIMGLWLLQQCRASWRRTGQEYSYSDLVAQATAAPAFGAVLEPDDSGFLAPTDMPGAIQEFCRRTGQPQPMSIGAISRCCFESLALRYRWTLERLEEFCGRRFTTIHIVGGGSQNELLCRMTASATNRRVAAGPVEATAIGNVLVQAIGLGHIGSLADARAVVRRSFSVTEYLPGAETAQWDELYARYTAMRSAIGKAD
ncbi:MAG: rhamnulokinase [Armatimonadetes bacterium]|nr:rhamnulokinase [Armatimonadota bacterium]MDE2207006.1 rhamnulokinase [Armatimonadota bacterium]